MKSLKVSLAVVLVSGVLTMMTSANKLPSSSSPKPLAHPSSSPASHPSSAAHKNPTHAPASHPTSHPSSAAQKNPTHAPSSHSSHPDAHKIAAHVSSTPSSHHSSPLAISKRSGGDGKGEHHHPHHARHYPARHPFPPVGPAHGGPHHKSHERSQIFLPHISKEEAKHLKQHEEAAAAHGKRVRHSVPLILDPSSDDKLEKKQYQHQLKQQLLPNKIYFNDEQHAEDDDDDSSASAVRPSKKEKVAGEKEADEDDIEDEGDEEEEENDGVSGADAKKNKDERKRVMEAIKMVTLQHKLREMREKFDASNQGKDNPFDLARKGGEIVSDDIRKLLHIVRVI